MLAAAVSGNVTRVVFRVIFGFVGMLVLLVHDNQAEVREGRKNGRACTDDKVNLPFRDAAPSVKALTLSE